MGRSRQECSGSDSDEGGNGDPADITVAQTRVQKFTLDGDVVAKWGSYGSGDRQFHTPVGIAVSPSGHLYVADMFNFRIQRFSSAGEFLGKWTTRFEPTRTPFNEPMLIAIDGVGRIFVKDGSNPNIQEFTSTGAVVRRWGEAGSGDGQFSTVFALAVDASGTVYVGDGSNQRVQTFSPD